MPVVSRT